ncbi:MAG TPA: hypothetical protein VEJ68_02720 [Candidatus Bathyarchaeia archaeon]|nr:hypothetical protein [Candidatus Bathyarchaeia archaeon]
MRKIPIFILVLSLVVLLFNTIQGTSTPVSQVNTLSFNSTNQKFDPGFLQKINNMTESGETGEYTTIIILEKT